MWITDNQLLFFTSTQNEGYQTWNAKSLDMASGVVQDLSYVYKGYSYGENRVYAEFSYDQNYLAIIEFSVEGMAKISVLDLENNELIMFYLRGENEVIQVSGFVITRLSGNMIDPIHWSQDSNDLIHCNISYSLSASAYYDQYGGRLFFIDAENRSFKAGEWCVESHIDWIGPGKDFAYGEKFSLVRVPGYGTGSEDFKIVIDSQGKKMEITEGGSAKDWGFLEYGPYLDRDTLTVFYSYGNTFCEGRKNLLGFYRFSCMEGIREMYFWDD